MTFAVAQQLVAQGVAILDEAEVAILLAVDDEVFPFLDRLLGFKNVLETL